ncbi:MAG TPA: PASTA domain-containing protein [Solirubrobacteraceae bacterium]|nr:PASTA domain-containing protein [Solirubrobacteraceae bacterium]
MSNTTAAPARSSQRAQRGAPSGRLTVGEYVGQRAAQAAQAVRRAGLRPGMNRSFGCDPELVGLVIAQEPASGSELARNGLVTLYVAAPGADPDQEALDAPAAAELDQPHDAPSEPVEAVLGEVQESPEQPRVRRRRKPGHAGSAPVSVGTPPAPSPPGSEIHGGAWEQELLARAPEDGLSADFELPVPRSGQALHEGSPQEAGGEEFVVHADDVFAGRTEPAWRRVYPRSPLRTRRLGAWRSWFAGRPFVVKAAGVLVAVWAVVALTSMLAGSTGSTHHASAVAGLERQHPIQQASVPAPRTPARGRARHVHRHAVLLAHDRQPARARRVFVRAERVRPRTVIAPRAVEAPAVSAPAPPTPAPVREQSQGGLFSP